MKQLILGVCAVIVMSASAQAQDVTEEHLWKYALMTEVIDQMIEGVDAMFEGAQYGSPHFIEQGTNGVRRSDLSSDG